MNVNKLSDAMNYIDDDLLASCDEVRSRASSKAKTTSINNAKKKAKMTRLWGSIAAAALVLVVGFTVLTLMNEGEKSNSKHKKHHDSHGGSKSEDVFEQDEYSSSKGDVATDDAEEMPLAPHNSESIRGENASAAETFFDSDEVEAEFDEELNGDGAYSFYDVSDPEFRSFIEALKREDNVFEGDIRDHDLISAYYNEYGIIFIFEVDGQYLLIDMSDEVTTAYKITQDELNMFADYVD